MHCVLYSQDLWVVGVLVVLSAVIGKTAKNPFRRKAKFHELDTYYAVEAMRIKNGTVFDKISKLFG